MTDYQQKVSGSFNERMRLNRLRRKKEKLRFWQEFRIVPKGLVWTVVALFLIAQAIAFSVNHWNFYHNGDIFAPEVRDTPWLSYLALAGVITLVSVTMAQLHFPDRLRQSRRKAPRHELCSVDAARHRPAPGLDFHRLPHLFPDARAAALRLPPMRKIRRRPLQLLPQLQMQPPPQLPQLQTRSPRNRQILPLLRPRIGSDEGCWPSDAKHWRKLMPYLRN